MTPADPVVRVRGVRKEYHSLRPLRIEAFDLGPSDTVALLGLDRAAAEVFVNMITGATLPDEGDMVIFGGSTREITTTDAWFGALDRFGILSERVVLIDELTIRQNLALPLSLDVDAMAPDVRRQVDALREEVRVPIHEADLPMGSAGPATKLRVRLGKALALKPDVILAEHPNASLEADEVPGFGRDLASIAVRRGIAMMLFTADTAFATAACSRVLTLNGATGELVPFRQKRRWFGGR